MTGVPTGDRETYYGPIVDYLTYMRKNNPHILENYLVYQGIHNSEKMDNDQIVNDLANNPKGFYDTAVLACNHLNREIVPKMSIRAGGLSILLENRDHAEKMAKRCGHLEEKLL